MYEDWGTRSGVRTGVLGMRIFEVWGMYEDWCMHEDGCMHEDWCMRTNNMRTGVCMRAGVCIFYDTRVCLSDARYMFMTEG